MGDETKVIPQLPPQDVQRVLVTQMHHSGRQFLDEWLGQMEQANNHAYAPSEESKDYWLFALAGNLLWAASCFVPGAGVIAGATATAGMSVIGKALYVTMSQGGALIGSGIAGQLARGASGDPTGKDVVQRALIAKRDELWKKFHTSVEAWASELSTSKEFKTAVSKSQEEFMETVDKILWTSMFPTIGYNDLTAMYNGALDKLTGVLADFNRQYSTWKKSQELPEARSRVYHGEPFLLNADQIERAKARNAANPFNPKLVFNLPGETAGPSRTIEAPYGRLVLRGTTWAWEN